MEETLKKAGIITTKAGGSKKFDDAANYKEGTFPTRVKVWSGSAVDAVQFIYADKALEKHGGNGGGCSDCTIADGKYIKKVRITCGTFAGVKVLTALAFYDQDGKKLAGNERGGDTKELTAEEGACICALYGETVRAGGIDVLSGVGIYTCKLPDISDLLSAFGNIKDKLF